MTDDTKRECLRHEEQLNEQRQLMYHLVYKKQIREHHKIYRLKHQEQEREQNRKQYYWPSVIIAVFELGLLDESTFPKNNKKHRRRISTAMRELGLPGKPS